jgi:CheY-like chemotaxis protein
MVRKVATLALGMYGYTVLGARCGERGHTCFMEYPDEIALVLSDIMMPVMSGLEMVARILKARRDVKVVFMTGNKADVALPAYYDKVFPVLQKPFTPKSLVACIRECLDCR